MRAFRAQRAALAAVALAAGLGITVPAAASASSQAPAASLKLAVGRALPGQGVKFTGGGYQAGESVTVYWKQAGGPQLTRVTASPAGTIAGAFTVPLPKGGGAKVNVVAAGASSRKQAKFAFVQACTDEWVNTKGGNWSSKASWSAHALPGPSTAACITLPAARKYTVTATRSLTVGSLQVGAPGGKTTQALALSAQSSDLTLTLEHDSKTSPHGIIALTNAGKGADLLQGPGRLQNFGFLQALRGQGSARFIKTTVINERGGSMGIQSVTHLDRLFTNQGSVSVAKGGAAQVGGGVVVQLLGGGSVQNAGQVVVSNGTIAKIGGAETGNAWQLTNGATLLDSAGSGAGAYTYYGNGTLQGVIPAGQTVTVAGHGKGVKLGLAGQVTNNGTLQLTSARYQGDGGGNAWLTAGPGSVPKLYNNGHLVTTTGAGGTKVLGVDVLNRSQGVIQVNAASTSVPGGSSITNAGTLNMGDAAVLDLAGDASGTANFIERDVATMGITVNGNTGKSSVIHQVACLAPATACQPESISLDGKLTVTTIGAVTPGSSFVPVYSDQSAVAGMFATIPDAYGATYNDGPVTGLPGLVGDMVLHAN